MSSKEQAMSLMAQEQSILGYFGRHLVALCVTSRQGDGPSRFTAYSGTLLRIDDAVLWLTAGHIVRQIEDVLESSHITIDESVLADAFGESFVSEKPVPIDLRASPRSYCDDDNGLDFGAIILHPHLVRLLIANGVAILEEVNWVRQHNVAFEGYMMLGLPDELTSQVLPDDGLATVSPTMIAVRRLEEEPEGHKLASPRLTARIIDPIPLASVVGMSGGPILGFAGNEKELRYWIVALQSAWLKETRTTFACPLPVFAPLLTEWVRSRTAEPA
jgi:hypothetical protein